MLYTPSTEDRALYERMSVVIVTPCGSHSNSFRFTRCLANMIAYSWQHGLKVGQFGGTERMVVHWARNSLALQAKDLVDERTGEKYTHILWLDDDQTFNPDLLCYLAKSGDKDIVSALYYSREEGKPYPVVYVRNDNGDMYQHYTLMIPPETLCEVDAVGFGACLMRREILDVVPSPWFRFNGCGEDIYFCAHARQAGFKVWLDGRYKIGHVGDPRIITVKDYDEFMAQNKEALGALIKVDLGGNHG